MNKLLILVTAMGCLLAAMLAHGEVQELITNGGAELGNTTNFPGLAYQTADAAKGKACFEKIGAAAIVGTEAIKVDPNQTYTVRVSLKSAGSGGMSKVYAGLLPLDKDNNPITPINYYQPRATQTTLAQKLRNGDTKVYLTSSVNWSNASQLASTRYIAVFGDPYYQAQGLYYYTRKVAGYQDVDSSSNSVILSAPWTGGFAAKGTPVSNTQDGSTYLYTVVNGDLIPSYWVNRAGSVHGISNIDQLNAFQFRPGTVYVKPVVLANYQQDANFSLRIDDFSLRQISPGQDILLLKNPQAEIDIASWGHVTSIKSASDGVEQMASAEPLVSISYLDPGDPSKNVISNASSIRSLGSDLYTLRFENISAHVDLLIVPKDGYFIFKIDAARDLPVGTDKIVFLNFSTAFAAQGSRAQDIAGVTMLTRSIYSLIQFLEIQNQSALKSLINAGQVDLFHSIQGVNLLGRRRFY